VFEVMPSSFLFVSEGFVPPGMRPGGWRMVLGFGLGSVGEMFKQEFMSVPEDVE
jgi:hypothetical protein